MLLSQNDIIGLVNHRKKIRLHIGFPFLPGWLKFENVIYKGKIGNWSWVFLIFRYVGYPEVVPRFFNQEAFRPFEFPLFPQYFAFGNYLLFFHILFFIMRIMNESLKISDHCIVEVRESATRAFIAVEKILINEVVKGRYILSIQEVVRFEEQCLPFVQDFCGVVDLNII